MPEPLTCDTCGEPIEMMWLDRASWMWIGTCDCGHVTTRPHDAVSIDVIAVPTDTDVDA